MKVFEICNGERLEFYGLAMPTLDMILQLVSIKSESRPLAFSDWIIAKLLKFFASKQLIFFETVIDIRYPMDTLLRNLWHDHHLWA